MTAKVFKAIFEQIKEDVSDPTIHVVVNAIQSHGGYSASDMTIDVSANDITLCDDFLKIRIRGDVYVTSVKAYKQNSNAYAYVPLSEVKCIYAIN